MLFRRPDLRSQAELPPNIRIEADLRQRRFAPQASFAHAGR